MYRKILSRKEKLGETKELKKQQKKVTTFQEILEETKELKKTEKNNNLPGNIRRN